MVRFLFAMLKDELQDCEKILGSYLLV